MVWCEVWKCFARCEGGTTGFYVLPSFGGEFCHLFDTYFLATRNEAKRNYSETLSLCLSQSGQPKPDPEPIRATLILIPSHIRSNIKYAVYSTAVLARLGFRFGSQGFRVRVEEPTEGVVVDNTSGYARGWRPKRVRYEMIRYL